MPLIISLSILFPCYIGNVDITKTIMINCSESLDDGRDRFVAQINTPNARFESWEYLDIYNRDFYNERFSVAFRISSDCIALQNELGEPIGVSKFSDIIQSTIDNNADQNMSALKISKSMTEFTSDSIILNEQYHEFFGLNQGDIVLISHNNKVLSFKIFDFYSSKNHGDFTRNSYLNQTYAEISEGVAFVDRSFFELFSSNKYDVFVSLGKEKNRVIACYRELKSFLSTNSGELSIPDYFSANLKTINDIAFTDYPSFLKSNYSDSIGRSLVLIYLIPIILIFLSLISYDLISPTISNMCVSINRFKLSIIALAYIVYAIGLYVLSSYLFVNLLPSYLFSSLFLSFDISLVWLVIIGILNIFILFLAIMSKVFFLRTVNSYNNAKPVASNFYHHLDCAGEQSKQSQVVPQNLINSLNKKVLFFGRFTAPTSSAGACRTLYLAEMFAKLGYAPIISSFTFEKELFLSKYGNVYLFPYATQPKTVKEKINLFLNSKKEIRNILSAFSQSKPEIVVIYSVLSIPAIKTIKKYCFSNNVKLIFDVVESQVISQQSFNSLFTYYLPQKYINSIAIDKHCSVISISTYLDEVYVKKGVSSIVIPFVSDTRNTPDCSKIVNELKVFNNARYILYAGNPFNKRDLLSPLFSAIQQLEVSERSKIRVIIAGVECDQLLKREGISKDDLLSTTENILILGRVPHHVIESLYRICDFSILIKPLKKKFSKAGFPTKVSESMAHGVPSICNISSDLQKYLTDQNSIIINGDKTKDVCDTLKKVICLNKNELISMRKAARDTSLNKLDINTFLEDLRVFLSN